MLITEEVPAVYFNETLLTAPRKMYRISGYKNGRYYYSFRESDGRPEFYISVTNLIASTMPTSPFLMEWKLALGKEEAERFVAERASYGTFMHILYAELLINRRLDLATIRKRLANYLEAERLPAGLLDEWEYELKKDVAAFAQFVQDYNVRPVFIEQVLASRDGYAGAVDLGCYMDIAERYKSGPKRGEMKPGGVVETVRAIVDFKSGRKGFYEAHEIQLEAYRNLVAENFPDFEVDRIYNFSPKDWRGTKPAYNLKDQTDSENLQKLPLLVELANLEAAKRERMVTQVTGLIDLDRPVADSVECLTMEELVVARQRKPAEPEAEQIADLPGATLPGYELPDSYTVTDQPAKRKPRKNK
jgi:hypothetical protein